jgi:mRNA-degrading endonuclease toxin of MazEF toxin-antitoxin module
MAEGAIPVRSRIKYDKVFTLEKTLVVKRLGKVSQQKLNKVRKGLISLLG